MPCKLLRNECVACYRVKGLVGYELCSNECHLTKIGDPCEGCAVHNKVRMPRDAALAEEINFLYPVEQQISEDADLDD